MFISQISGTITVFYVYTHVKCPREICDDHDSLTDSIYSDNGVVHIAW